MRRLYYAAFTYTILGLLGGLYYRELTKAQDFPEDGFTQLSVVHTHLFALGMLVMLIVLALEKVFGLTRLLFDLSCCEVSLTHLCVSCLGVTISHFSKDPGPC